LTGTYSVIGQPSSKNIEIYVVDQTECPSSIPNPYACSQYIVKEDRSFNNNLNVDLEPGETYYVGFSNPTSDSSEVKANLVLEY
jgi:hypothetical protein